MHEPRPRNTAAAMFFKGLFLTATVSVIMTACVVLYGMKIINGQAGQILDLAQGAVEDLPEFLQDMPPIVSDVFKDRRSPDYLANLNVTGQMAASSNPGRVYPVVTIVNDGDEMVTLLSVRLSALNAEGTPIYEWNEVVATPFATGEDEFPGPMLPGAERKIILDRYLKLAKTPASELSAKVEITDIRVWDGNTQELTAEGFTAMLDRD